MEPPPSDGDRETYVPDRFLSDELNLDCHSTINLCESSLLVIDVHPADVQDRDGAAEAIAEMLRTAPTVEKLFADGGYSGPKLAGELQEPGFSEMLEFVFNPKDTKGFSVLYRLWVVERTSA